MEQYPDLQSLFLFVKVAEASSFTKVSKLHNIPKATLSRKISQLESFYGAQLLVRNTRHLQLTQLGKELLKKSQLVLSTIQESQDLISKSKGKPQGLIRITAGVEFGMSFVAPLVNTYLQQHSEVQIELDLTGRRVDLIYEGFDLGIRIGSLQDSTIMMKKVGSFRYGLFCGPQFYKEQKPLDLKKLELVPTLGFSRTENRKIWNLIHSSETQKVEIRPRLVSNNYWTLLTAAEANLGVVFMPQILAQKSVKNKSLIHLLPQWTSSEIPVSFVYPAQKHLSPQVRHFIQYVTQELSSDFSMRRTS